MFLQKHVNLELVEYERALHRVLDVPMITIYAYNVNMVIKASNPTDPYNELFKAHGRVLFTGIDNKLGEVEIRQA